MHYAFLSLLLLLSAGHQGSRSDPQSRPAPEARIFVHGAARKTGWLRLPAEYTLLRLVTDAADRADLSEVLVVRQDKTNPLVFEVDVRHMVTTGDTTWNVILRDGDIVHFRKDRTRAASRPVR